MDETIPSISRYPPVEVHRDPSTGNDVVCLDGSERIETDSRLGLVECGGRCLDTGGSACRRVVHRGLAERAEEDPVRVDLVDVSRETGSECPSPSRS